MIYGVDVSDYQPANFPLTDGHTHSANFAFIKLTEGTGYVNPKVQDQTAWARKNGLRVGFYHFLRPGNIQEQIAFFREKADSLNVYRVGDIIGVDWEDEAGSHPSNSEKDEAISAALSKFSQSRVVLYCNKDFWLNVDRTSVCGDGLWIAAPDDPDGAPAIKHSWVFQQVSVVNGEDWDVAQFESRAALDNWALGKVPAVTLPSTFVDVVQTDGIPVPAGHSDPDGNWSLGTYLKSIHQTLDNDNSTVANEIAEIKATLAEIKALLTPPAPAPAEAPARGAVAE